MLSVLVERYGLKHLVRLVKNGAAGGLVNAARLHADKPVFNKIGKTNSVFAA